MQLTSLLCLAERSELGSATLGVTDRCSNQLD